MKILAVVQNKGGVGKTTLARILAEYFARSGRRVLALDLDPQCNFSRRFLEMPVDPSDPEGVVPPRHPDPDWDGYSSTADIFNLGTIEPKDGEHPGVLPYPTDYENLEILPGHASRLLRTERVREEEVEEKIIGLLEAFLQLEDLQALYDVVIMDTPPTKGPLTRASVRAATHIMIPSVLEPLSMEGLFGMMQLWMRENRRRPADNPLNLVGIVPNMYQRNRLQDDYLSELQNDPATAPLIIPVKLHKLVAFVEPDAEGAQPKSVLDRKETDKARTQAEKLCKHVEKRMFQ